MSYYIGLMSGTSLDGIDAALVDFSNNPPQLLCSHYQAFNNDLKTRLEKLCFQTSIELPDLGALDSELGSVFSECILQLIAKSQLSPDSISAIGSHGQTIYHSPRSSHPFSLQIGDPNTISKQCGIPVIADFRRADIAVGGQGAPLVPAFHKAVLQSEQRHRTIVNIGGIANITILSDNLSAPIIGFDTGPGNTLLDYWSRSHTGKLFDIDGQLGRSGATCQSLLKLLRDDCYFNQPAPKSTGQEHFSTLWLNNNLDQLNQAISVADVQATLYELTASTIADAIQAAAPETQQILICGGGAHNPLLMERLKANLAQYSVESTMTVGIDPDWVEAMAFAWLAYCFIEKIPSNLPSVTGAARPVILGGCYMP